MLEEGKPELACSGPQAPIIVSTFSILMSSLRLCPQGHLAAQDGRVELQLFMAREQKGRKAEEHKGSIRIDSVLLIIPS